MEEVVEIAPLGLNEYEIFYRLWENVYFELNRRERFRDLYLMAVSK